MSLAYRSFVHPIHLNSIEFLLMPYSDKITNTWFNNKLFFFYSNHLIQLFMFVFRLTSLLTYMFSYFSFSLVEINPIELSEIPYGFHIHQTDEAAIERPHYLCSSLRFDFDTCDKTNGTHAFIIWRWFFIQPGGFSSLLLSSINFSDVTKSNQIPANVDFIIQTFLLSLLQFKSFLCSSNPIWWRQKKEKRGKKIQSQNVAVLERTVQTLCYHR